MLREHKEAIRLLKDRVFADFSTDRESDFDAFYVDVGLQISVKNRAVFFDRGSVDRFIDVALCSTDAHSRVGRGNITLDSVGLIRDFVGLRCYSSSGVGDIGAVFFQGYSTERVMTARKRGLKSGMCLAPKAIISSFANGHSTIPYYTDIRSIIEAYVDVSEFPSRFEVRVREENISQIFWGVTEDLIRDCFYIVDGMDWW